MKLLRSKGWYGVYDLGSPCEHCQAVWRDMGGRDGVDQDGRPTGGVLDKGFIYLHHARSCPENFRSDAEFLALPLSSSPTYVRPVRVRA